MEEEELITKKSEPEKGNSAALLLSLLEFGTVTNN